MFFISISDNFCNQASFINTKIRNLQFQKENEAEGESRGSCCSPPSLGVRAAVPCGGYGRLLPQAGPLPILS